MSWDIEVTDEFERWWDTLDEDEREDVRSVVGLLEEKGPTLPFPHSSGVVPPNMRGCANCEFSTRADPTESYMLLILAALQYC